MNDRDKTDVWSTSGVILIIFQSLFCFLLCFLGLWAAGNKRKRRAGERRKASKGIFDLCFIMFEQIKEVLRLRLVH